MGSKSAAIGGGSGAVVTSAHAGCERFRGTDPLITGQTRRALASSLGVPKPVSGSIPESRWVRALTFESLVHDAKFASQIVELSLAGAGLPRPKAVTVLNANEETAETKKHIEKALLLAQSGKATLIHAAAVPPPGFTQAEATLVLPDFIVVTADPMKTEHAVIVVGDAKDYERVRSKIDDSRMLKGFLQVAFGVASFESWGDLPPNVSVSQFGVLAVPRNAFLQPTIVSEYLADHKSEVLLRLEQRVADAGNIKWTGVASDFVLHLKATYDPDSCRTCPLFEYCRKQIRESSEPLDLLQEIGIPRSARKRLEPVVSGDAVDTQVPIGETHRVLATISGKAICSGKKRTDPVALPGTVNVVIAKSDSAALGVYGLSVQVINDSGAQGWQTTVFPTPQSDETRRQILGVLGRALFEAADGNLLDVGETKHLTLVAPDATTIDILASIADTIAGNEISRLRWQRDTDMGRPALTFDGQPAVIPLPLTSEQRLATSFLIEEDRARAFQGRRPTVNLASVLNELLIAGGPATSSGRLDYLTEWANTITGNSLNHRAIEDDIETRENTPGARLSVLKSNEIHKSLMAAKFSKSEMDTYCQLVSDELSYKVSTFERAVERLGIFDDSNLRGTLLQLERDAQRIWRRRFEFHAFDLVRFGLTPRNWRNSLVEVVEKDAKAVAQLNAVLNPVWADTQAKSAGTRELAIARVLGISPLKLRIESRKFGIGAEIVLLHINGLPCVETPGVTSKPLATFLQVRGMSKCTIEAEEDERLVYRLNGDPPVKPGDELVIADAGWFEETNRQDEIKIVRSKPDGKSAPDKGCDGTSYQLNPEEHKWCCRPHEEREAETADWFAAQRADGKMNPQIWPPVVDAEAFDQVSPDAPNADTIVVSLTPLPDAISPDDLD